MSALNCHGVVKAYHDRRVLNGVDLELPTGGVYALLGSSGGGKTTLARILCGIEPADRGTVTFSGPACVMLIPQDFVVWPHLSVFENVAFGYRGPKAGRDMMVSGWLSRLRLEAAKGQPAGELSYGQQQRVAVARAFCFQPDLMVLDEPFAHFDAPSRTKAAAEIAALCFEQKMTTLWITHDAREAFAVAEKVAILEGGVIRQFAAPESVYRAPATEQVALLTGEINILQPDEWTEFSSFCNDSAAFQLVRARTVGLRPADVEIAAVDGQGCRFFGRTFLGQGYHYHARLSSGLMMNLFSPDLLSLEGTYRFNLKSKPCVFQ